MDLEAFRLAADRRRSGPAGAGHEAVRRARRRPGCDRAPPCATAPTPATAGRRADPGRPAAAGGAKFGDRRRADVLHARRARAGHPARVAAHRAAAGRRCRRRPRCSTWAAASAATWWRWPRPGSTVAGVDRDPCGSRWPRPTSPPSACGGAVQVADATTRRPRRVRRGVRRPGPPHRARAGSSTSTTGRRRGRSSCRCSRRDACVKVAPGHPARPGARRRRGRVGQRRRRGQGGGALVGPAGGRAPPGDGDRRRRAGHPDRRGRPGRRRSCRSGGTSTSPTER